MTYQPKRGPSREIAGAGIAAVFLGLFTFAGLSREGALDSLKILLVAGSIALVVRWCLGEPYQIPSGSMEPTLHGDPRFLRGDRVFVNKWVYGVRVPFSNKRLWRGAEPRRWDIVVFKSPEANPEYPILIKRVVGLPGERVHIAGGRLHVNGQPEDLPTDMPAIQYTEDGQYGVQTDDAHAVVPPDHYFVLGDNSRFSRDGRVFGWVPNENVVGRAFCIMWPVTRWRDFTGFTRTWWWHGLVGLLSLFTVFRLFLGRSWHVRASALGDPVFDGERVYVSRWVYGLPLPFTRMRFLPGRTPRRGEYVLYRAPGRRSGKRLGRVTAIPGDPIRKRDGRTVPLPEGRYLVAREGESTHAVRKEDLIGPVTAVWWPPRRWRRVRT